MLHVATVVVEVNVVKVAAELVLPPAHKPGHTDRACSANANEMAWSLLQSSATKKEHTNESSGTVLASETVVVSADSTVVAADVGLAVGLLGRWHNSGQVALIADAKKGTAAVSSSQSATVNCWQTTGSLNEGVDALAGTGADTVAEAAVATDVLATGIVTVVAVVVDVVAISVVAVVVDTVEIVVVLGGVVVAVDVAVVVVVVAPVQALHMTGHDVRKLACSGLPSAKHNGFITVWHPPKSVKSLQVYIDEAVAVAEVDGRDVIVTVDAAPVTLGDATRVVPFGTAEHVSHVNGHAFATDTSFPFNVTVKLGAEQNTCSRGHTRSKSAQGSTDSALVGFTAAVEVRREAAMLLVPNIDAVDTAAVVVIVDATVVVVVVIVARVELLELAIVAVSKTPVVLAAAVVVIVVASVVVLLATLDDVVSDVVLTVVAFGV